MSTKNSISSLLAQFMRLQTNAMEVVSKLSDATTSDAESVTITLLDEAGAEQESSVPSFGFIKSEIRRLDSNIQQLAGLGDASTLIKLPDGTVKKVYQVEVLRDPPAITSVQVPADFSTKNNWFFESFLNPLLFVTIDVSGRVPDDMERAVVKRVIVNCETDAQKAYFDETYKGRNDVSHDAFFIDLDSEDIGWFVDEEVIDLPISMVRYTGSFDVLGVQDEDTTVTSGSRTVNVKRRKYRLNRLTFTDALSGVADSKNIEIGTQLITADGSKYTVASVDAAERTIVVTRSTGSQSIKIGSGVLTIYSPPFKTKEVQVNVGHNERQVVFLKPVEAKFNVASSTYSPGIAFFSSDLTIGTPEGAQSLDEFYKTQVVDFGQQFITAAKERLVPSSSGEQPDAPAIEVGNFKVVQINAHKKNSKEAEEINNKLASKVKLENEMKQLDLAIDQKKSDLNSASPRSEAERRQIKADMETIAREKASKTNLYSSVIHELALIARSNPASLDGAKFRIRGFFPIPDAKPSDLTGPQEVVQFEINYRYLRPDGNAQQPEEIAFKDGDGTDKRGLYSNWIAYRSEVRKKIYNESTGFYEWDVEDVQDGEVVNVNQVDIPITRGEQVQIRIRSLSEAGFPVNPVLSEWSDTVTVTFPDDLVVDDGTALAVSEAAQEEVRVKFQEELSARSLDLHLLSSFSNGDRYFAHTASDMASGFYTAEGKVIDMFEKLKDIEARLEALTQLVSRAKGTLAIYIVDADGNVTAVQPNTTVTLFAGYYKDAIAAGSGLSITYDHGKVVTKSYTLRIENSAATALELATYLPGGASVKADESENSQNNSYKNNMRYDLVPLSLSGVSNQAPDSLKNEAPYQSSQVQGQWLYSRYKSVGLDETLYGLTDPAADATAEAQGVPATFTGTSPVNGCYLFPTDPTLTAGPASSDVWNGVENFTGGGVLTEFCLHKNHKLATNDYSATTFVPQATSTNMAYPPAFHSDFFWKDVTTADHKLQLQQITPTVFDGSTTTPQNYPAKLGFSKGDEHLIGKYTCGAYLFPSPVDHDSVRVEGTTELAKKLLEFGEDKAISIPVVFQFRCSDKIGRIGGYRPSGNITNVTYVKKVGLDVQVRGEAPFSFDIEVTCKYEQDSLTKPTYVPGTGLEALRSIRANQR